MKLTLGLPEGLAAAPLPRRLAGVLFGRLLLLVSVVLVASSALPALAPGLDSASGQVVWLTVALALALSAVYAAWLRSGRAIDALAHTQLILDQLLWTVFVYLTGGATSGAASLYGVSCLVGATLTGLRGATVAAISAMVFYLALILGLSQGWVEPPRDQPARLWTLTPSEFGYHAFVTLLVLVVVSLLGGYLAERLRLQGGQLVQAEARAEDAERLAVLGRLAAGLAHEIRNPLGAISASVKLLETGSALSVDERELCQLIHRETARLDDLVSDMMDLSRTRAPQLQAVDVGRLAQEVVAMSAHSGRAAGDVSVSYGGASAAQVRADPGQLRQLLWNLIRNAVQASKPGGVVQVSVERHAHLVELAVHDQGDGIDAAARARLFDAFFTTRSKGTGIGLAVVKRIADEHGFTIDVESEHGQGATFRVRLGEELTPRA